jgi:glycosyltransferase involved in cell wall biosynthesis
VVVIGLNESLHLGRCLESVRVGLDGAAEHLSDSEVIYVDSGSEDDSTDVALRWADAVFRLKCKPSAAAARAAGLEECKGEIVLLLDGDMELDEAWLREALQTWSESGFDSNVAGLIGIRDDVRYRAKDGNVRILGIDANVYRTTRKSRAFHFGGALLARTDVLRRVGGYRSRLHGFEEPDLHARLRADGWQVLELPLLFIRHYLREPAPAWRRLLRSFDPRGPSFEFGRMFRSAIVEGYLSGFVAVCRAPVAVWAADSLSAVMLAFGMSWALVAGAQLVAAAVTLLWRRPEDFLLARGRLVGVAAALVGRDQDGLRLYPHGTPESPPRERVEG